MNETPTPIETDPLPEALPATADVVVIGAGVAGLLAAWRAAAAGAEVVVIDDPERIGAGTVGAGMLAPVGEASWGEESLLAAGLAAVRAWPELAAELSAASGLEVPYRRCGSLHIALDGDEAAELERRHRLHERLGLGAKQLLGSDCRRLEPGLASDVRAGLALDGEAEVDPRALLRALRRAAADAGAALVPGRAESLDATAGTVGVGGGAAIEAATVVLAAGAWAGAEGLLADEQRLPVRPVRGEIIRLRAAPGRLPADRIIAGERFYLVPRESGEVVIGATVEEKGFDQRVSAGGVLELLREAYRALPELAELELVEVAAGLRPGSPDNAPIIGRLDDSRVIAVGGLYRSGILLAPLVGDAVAALLAGDEVPEAAAGFGPERFGVRAPSSRRTDGTRV